MAKGTRDLNPGEALTREEIIDSIKACFKLYGFMPLELPILERYETVSSKYAGGSEILKEVFKLKDQGNRELALRYEFTVSLARYVAMNPGIKMPFKAYQIGKVFRDGPIKFGRYREFSQVDADIVGSSSIMADAECVKLALDVFKKLGIKAIIKVNNRKILDAILDNLSIKDKEVILTIDKLEKIGKDGVKNELKAKGLDEKQIKKLIEIISINGSNKEIIKRLKKIVGENDAIKELEELVNYVKDKKVVVVLSLARGLAYYTGNIFEAFSPALKSSIAGGGRYDEMISKFAGRQEYPAVGISFGLDTIYDILNRKEERSSTKAYIIPINAEKQAISVLDKLRQFGINADIDLNGRGISKNLEYASKLNIPYVVFIGKKELAKKKVKLRDMETGRERLLTVKQVIYAVKNE